MWIDELRLALGVWSGDARDTYCVDHVCRFRTSLRFSLTRFEWLNVDLREVELSEQAGCLFSAHLVRLLRQSQQTIQACVVLFDVLCFKVLPEHSLGSRQTLLNKAVIVIASFTSWQFYVLLDLSHDIVILRCVGRQ